MLGLRRKRHSALGTIVCLITDDAKCVPAFRADQFKQTKVQAGKERTRRDRDNPQITGVESPASHRQADEPTEEPKESSRVTMGHKISSIRLTKRVLSEWQGSHLDKTC